jgi:signal transduction histidine kinase
MTGTGGGDAQERITRLHEVAADLQAASGKPEVYDAVIEAAVEILGFDWCTVAVPADGYFELRSVSDAAPLKVGEQVLRIDEGVAGRTYQEQETVLFTDQDHDDAKPIRESITSGLSIPLGEWGIFQGIAEEASAFDDHDREAAELLATHATAALDRIEREQELKEKNDRLEKFASVVSHDLRNPLNVAGLRLAMVREECDSEHIDDIEGALDRMEQLVENLLALARAGDEVQNVEPVELATLGEVCWETLDSGDGSLSIEGDLTLLADASRFRQLLENLMKNAVEHGSTNNQTTSDDAVEHGSTRPPSQAQEDTGSEASESSVADAPEDGEGRSPSSSRAEPDDAVEHGGPDVTVRIGALDSGFYVEDTGAGIPPDERDEIFESGYSTDDDGTGFGLSIVKDIVDAHGWTVTVTESEEGGARFEITGVTVTE